MTRIHFQGLVPFPPEDKVDDWGLALEQQVGTATLGRGWRAAHPAGSRRAGPRPQGPLEGRASAPGIPGEAGHRCQGYRGGRGPRAMDPGAGRAAHRLIVHSAIATP